MDCMILALYYLQSYYLYEITRGQHNLGNYHLHTQFQNFFCEQSIPEMEVYPPEEIIQHIKGEILEKNNKRSTQKEVM